MVGYYEILEVQQTATSGDIRRAYRRLALRWHPDKNPENLEEANRRFKEISEAYEVLIDERKRRIYDQYGKEGLQTPGGERQYWNDFPPRFDIPRFMFRHPEEVFREFFGAAPFEFPNVTRVYRHSHPSSSSINTPLPPPPPPPPHYFCMRGPRFSFPPPFPLHPHSLFRGPPGNYTWFNASFSGGSGATLIRQTSISTKFINGKKITIKRVLENGMEITTLYENDVLKTRMVNGVHQLIMYN